MIWAIVFLKCRCGGWALLVVLALLLAARPVGCVNATGEGGTGVRPATAGAVAGLATSDAAESPQQLLERFTQTGDIAPLLELTRSMSPKEIDSALKDLRPAVAALSETMPGAFRQIEAPLPQSGQMLLIGPNGSEKLVARSPQIDPNVRPTGVHLYELAADGWRPLAEVSTAEVHSLAVSGDGRLYVCEVTGTDEPDMDPRPLIVASEIPPRDRHVGEIMPPMLRPSIAAVVAEGKLHLVVTEQFAESEADSPTGMVVLYANVLSQRDPGSFHPDDMPAVLPPAVGSRFQWLHKPVATAIGSQVHVLLESGVASGRGDLYYTYQDGEGWSRPVMLCAGVHSKRVFPGLEQPLIVAETVVDGQYSSRVFRGKTEITYDTPWDSVPRASAAIGDTLYMAQTVRDRVLLFRHTGRRLEGLWLTGNEAVGRRAQPGVRVMMASGGRELAVLWAWNAENVRPGQLAGAALDASAMSAGYGLFRGEPPAEGWLPAEVLLAQMCRGIGMSEVVHKQLQSSLTRAAEEAEAAGDAREAVARYLYLLEMAGPYSDTDRDLPTRRLERLWAAGLTEVHRQVAGRLERDADGSIAKILKSHFRLRRFLARYSADEPEQDAATVAEIMRFVGRGEFVVQLAGGKEVVVTPDLKKLAEIFYAGHRRWQPDYPQDLEFHDLQRFRDHCVATLDMAAEEKVGTTPIALYYGQFSCIVSFHIDGYIHQGTVRLDEMATWTVRPATRSRADYLRQWRGRHLPTFQMQAEALVSLDLPRLELRGLLYATARGRLEQLSAERRGQVTTKLVELSGSQDREIAGLAVWAMSALPGRQGQEALVTAIREREAAMSQEAESILHRLRQNLSEDEFFDLTPTIIKRLNVAGKPRINVDLLTSLNHPDVLPALMERIEADPENCTVGPSTLVGVKVVCRRWPQVLAILPKGSYGGRHGAGIMLQWYAEHKDRLRWDDEKRVMVLEPEKQPADE